MSIVYDVCVVTPFRRPVFRHMISHRYPVTEPWDSPQFQVAACLESAGLKVAVLPLQTLFASFELERDQPVLDRLIEEHECRVLIFCGDHFVPSRSTATVFGIKEILRSLKRVQHAPVTALMGRLATTASTRVLSEVDGLDVALLGECDARVAEFVHRILDGQDGSDLPFVATRTRLNAVPERIGSLGSLPRPAYHLAKPMIEWGVRTGRIVGSVPFSLRTSAGCVFRCAFCAGVPDWSRWRVKSRAQLEEEIDWFRISLGDKGQIIFLEDELLTLRSDHVENVVSVLSERNLRLAGFYTHSRLIDFDRARRLAEVFDRVYIGMDAADNDVLKSMKKNQTIESMLNTLQSLRGSGLGVHIECVIGSPSETRQSLLKNLAALHNFLLLGLIDAANTYVFVPHPGTAYAEQSDHYGFEILEEFGYMQESGGYPTVQTKLLTRNEIFVAYLISQLVIQETMHQVRTRGTLTEVGQVNFDQFDALFARIAGCRL